MKNCLLLMIAAGYACSPQKKITFTPDYSPGPPTIVYKTKADYSRNVPVTLSEDRTQIVAYPHPSDLKSGFPYPTKLNQGYLLDNRGISANTVFLSYTYEEYATLDNAPDLKTMMGKITNPQPFAEFCNCGNRKSFSNPIDQLNLVINAGKLKEFCRTK